MPRVRVLVSGLVQGVFFRESTRRTAERLGLRGWVRNLTDGRVEGVFEGPEEPLRRMVDWCRKGPPSAEVQRVETFEEPEESLRAFEVRRTAMPTSEPASTGPDPA